MDKNKNYEGKTRTKQEMAKGKLEPKQSNTNKGETSGKEQKKDQMGKNSGQKKGKGILGEINGDTKK